MNVGTYLLPYFVCFDSSATALLRAVLLPTLKNIGCFCSVPGHGDRFEASHSKVTFSQMPHAQKHSYCV